MLGLEYPFCSSGFRFPHFVGLDQAFASSISFRMMAVRATFGGFAALIMAWYLSFRSGLKRMATSAGM